MRRLVFALSCMVALAVVSSPGASRAGGSDIARLLGWMSGSFSSAAQAAADTSYFDIRLEMARIWPERTDGAWLYVEQAAASALARPYRQRVYRVTAEPGGVFRSAVFELPAPSRFAGAWRTPAALAALTPDSLLAREGCAVLLKAEGDSAFAGETPGRECLSSLRGASWASSKVRVTARGITSWDQGWNAAGEQVWGAEKGPYRFARVRHD